MSSPDANGNKKQESSPPPEQTAGEGLGRNLEALCRFACGVVKVDHSGFVWFRPTLDYGDVVAQFPSEGFEELLNREVKLEGIEAEQRLINEVDAIEIPDVDDPIARQALGPVAELLDEFRIKSLYIVKVWVRGEVIGSFSVDRTGTAKGFTAEERKLCESLARLASSTIENALWSDWLHFFQEATTAIISQQELQPLLDTVVKHAMALLAVEEAGIYERLCNLNGEYLQLSGWSRKEVPQILRREDGGMAWELVDGKDGGQGYLETTDYSQYPHAAKAFQNESGSVLPGSHDLAK